MFYFIVNNTAAIGISILWSQVLFTRRSWYIQSLASIVGFYIVTWFSLMLLGLHSWLYNSAIMALLLVHLGGVFWLYRRNCFNSSILLPLSLKTHSPKTILRNFFQIAAIFAFAIGLGWLTGRCFLQGTFFSWDDLWYHAVAPAYWLQAKDIYLPPIQGMSAYYPFNAELLSLWFIMPFNSDGFAVLTGLYWSLLCSAAAFSLVIFSGRSMFHAIWVVLFMVRLNLVRDASHTFSGTDLAGPALLLCVLSFLQASRQNNRPFKAEFIYAGLTLGLAGGIKLTIAPIALIIFIWGLFLIVRQTSGRRRIATFAVFVGAMLATGSYWYLRNWVLTGNPFFPSDIGPFEGPFTQSMGFNRSLARWFLETPTDKHFWWKVLQAHFSTNPLIYGCAVASYFVVLFRRLVIKRHDQNQASSMQLVLLLSGGVMLIIYPFLPFSGATGGYNPAFILAPRYIIYTYCAGILLLILELPLRPKRPVWWLAGGIILISFLWQANMNYPKISLSSLALSALALVAVWTWPQFWKIWYKRIPRRDLVCILMAGLFIIGLGCHEFRQHQLTTQRLYTVVGNDSPINHAWKFAAQLPPKTRITWFGPQAGQCYPLFGRHYELIPVKIDEDGSDFQSIHQRWMTSKGQMSLYIKYPPQINFDNLVENLVSHHIDYVFTTKWMENIQPPQYEVLHTHPNVHCVYDDGYSAVFQILPILH